MMIAGVTIHNIEIMNFIEIMLGGISCIYARYTRVEPATEDSRKTGFLETVFVSPLPTILEMGFVFGFVIGGIEIIDTSTQTSLHNRQILIRQSKIHNDIRTETLEKSNQLFYIVGIDLCGLDRLIPDSLHNGVAFRFRAAGYHNLCKNVGVLRHFVRGHGSYSAGTDNKDFSHFTLLFMNCRF